MQSDDPPFLPVGTEVSAKFKGAFCEAKIKRISRSLKCKVLVKDPPLGVMLVDEDSFKNSSVLELGGVVEFTNEKGTFKGTLHYVKDYSTYHVVFNDGDEKTLKRSQICRKSPKHFAVNLDALPLYNPEQFSSPVLKGRDAKDKKRKVAANAYQGKRRKQDGEEEDGEEDGEEDDDDSVEGSTKSIRETNRLISKSLIFSTVRQTRSTVTPTASTPEDRKRGRKKMDTSSSSTSDSPVEKVRKPLPQSSSSEFAVGDVYCIFDNDKLEGKWFPGVIVDSAVYQRATKGAKVPGVNEVALRSLQNSRYYSANQTFISRFELKDRSKIPAYIKMGVEKAFAYIEKNILPPGWEKSDIFGISASRRPKFDESIKMEKESSYFEDIKDVKTEEKIKQENSDEEERKNFFVAQLYKFQEERGTPMNVAPVIGNQDLDLHMFHEVVNEHGGFKRITANNHWDDVLVDMKLENVPEATPESVKAAYEKFLFHFDAFHKRLGWSIGNFSSTSSSRSRDRRPTLPAAEAATPKTSEKTTKKETTKGKVTRKSKAKSSKKKKKVKHIRKVKRPRWKQRKIRKNIVNIRYSIPGYFHCIPFVKMYVGQPVLVQYEGDWYDAQTIKMSQPAIELLVKRFSELQHQKNGMKKIIKLLETSRRTNQIFVHYSDWDSSFDEWIYLDDIQIKAADLYAGCHIMKKICEDLKVDLIVWEKILKFYGVYNLFHYLQSKESNPKFVLDEDEPIRLKWVPDNIDKYTRKFAHLGGHTKYPYRRRRTFRLTRWRRKFVSSQLDKWKTYKFMKFKNNSCRVKKPPRGRNKRNKNSRAAITAALGEGKPVPCNNGSDMPPRVISKERELELKGRIMAKAISILEPVYDLKFVRLENGTIIHIPLPTKQPFSGRCPVKQFRERMRIPSDDVYYFLQETPRVTAIINKAIAVNWDCDFKELAAIVASVPYVEVRRRGIKPLVKKGSTATTSNQFAQPSTSVAAKAPVASVASVASVTPVTPVTPVTSVASVASVASVSVPDPTKAVQTKTVKAGQPPTKTSTSTRSSDAVTVKNVFLKRTLSELYFSRKAMSTPKSSSDGTVEEEIFVNPVLAYLRKLRFLRACRTSSCNIKKRVRTKNLRGERIKLELLLKSSKCRRERLDVCMLKHIGLKRFKVMRKAKKLNPPKLVVTSVPVSIPLYHDLIKPIPSIYISPASVYFSKDNGSSSTFPTSLSTSSSLIVNSQFGTSSTGFQPVVSASTSLAFNQVPSTAIDFSQLNPSAAFNALGFTQVVNPVGFNAAVNAGLGFHPVPNAGHAFNQVVPPNYNLQTQAQQQPHSQAQPMLLSQPQAKPQSKPKAQPVTQTQHQSKAQTKPQVQPQLQHQGRAQPQPQLQSQIQAKIQSPIQPQLKLQQQCEVKVQQPQPRAQTHSLPKSQAQVQAHFQHQSQPQIQPQLQPQLQRLTQPQLQHQIQTSFQSQLQSQAQTQAHLQAQLQTQAHAQLQQQILPQSPSPSHSQPQPQFDVQSISPSPGQQEESSSVVTVNGRPLITTKAAVKVVSTPAILARSRLKALATTSTQASSSQPITTPNVSSSPAYIAAAALAKNSPTQADVPSSISSFTAVTPIIASVADPAPRVTVPVPSTPPTVSTKITPASVTKPPASVDKTKKPPETEAVSTPKAQEPRTTRTPLSAPPAKVEVETPRKASPSSLKRKASSQELTAPAAKQSKSKEKAPAVPDFDETKTCLFSVSASKQKSVVMEKMKKEESTADYALLGICVDLQELSDVPDFSDEKIDELFARLEALKDLYDCEKKNLLVSEKEYKERVEILLRESLALPM